MDLVTKPLETAEATASEVTKETKATEGLSEFGKVDKIQENEQISFGKSGGGDCVKPICLGKKNTSVFDKQISFGSLANGEFKNNENYIKWKDGVDVGEVDESWIKELSNEISAIYGYDKIKATSVENLNNAGMAFELGHLIYDPEYLTELGNTYGVSTIMEVISHEVGHRVVYNLGLADELTTYEQEACADYIAGLTTRLCKLNGTHALSFYNSLPEISTDDIHPGKFIRMESFIRGLSRIDRGKEASLLKTFEVFSPYDLDGVYQNSSLLKSILYEDVIAPLRTGELKKV